MRTAPHPARWLAILLILAACTRGPSADEAAIAIRRGTPGVDSAVAWGHVWQDGPPWFSCAEVLAKIGSGADSAVVRNQVGNWKPLVVAGLVTLRDSAKGPVADPGWCTLKPTATGQPRLAAWTAAPGPEFPTGSPRRGWRMVVGQRHLAVTDTRMAGKDSATAEYLVAVRPNPDGAAIAADRDTARFIAILRRTGGEWRLASSRPAPPAER